MNSDKAFDSHNISVKDRRHTEMTGIDDVLAFDETMISVHSSMGDMIIEGYELKIDNFSSEKGILSISGKLSGLFYLDSPEKKRIRKKRDVR